MKLTKDQLQFIHNYLKNSGVEYIDVRFEMTDHVATALEEQEGDFYENFRLYMARNKKSLMESNRKFGKIAQTRAFKILFGNMLKPLPVIAMVCAILLLSTAKLNLEIVQGILQVFTLLPFLLMFILQFAFYRKTNKLSVTDKLFSTIALGYQVLIFILPAERIFNSLYYSCIFYAALFVFVSVNLYTFYSLSKKYKKVYSI